MSGSFESVRWNACIHRLDLGLYSHPKEFWGSGVRTHVSSKGKIPLPEKFSSEEDGTPCAASSRTASPTRYQQSYPGPYCIVPHGLHPLESANTAGGTGVSTRRSPIDTPGHLSAVLSDPH